MSEPKINYLHDYTPSIFSISKTALRFEIFESHVVVTNSMQLHASQAGETLRLHGEKLELVALTCNGETLENYYCDDKILEIQDFPMEATLEVVTQIYPHKNTELEGLYHSGDMFCTQNEPEGFRRITYFLDRPDVMSIFTTMVVADATTAPVLLSNGNLKEHGLLDNGRHYALWHDPFPKPSYLFALVAGDLGRIDDTFTTMSGREIALNIYCDHGNELRCHHAMRSLKKAMTWDEEVYGREYDLDIYNIVAVDSFNMGAMENKGLNIFNSAYVLADEDRATDANFMGIESVIAHEYFHNWTGNRITCRDWFQLTLKEGLTVFRDQSFSADMNDAVTQRISDVKMLRERQFVEDASATAHPIKPEKYIEINNFYTATVYEKGAEVIRMIHTMLGQKRWRAAMDLYFETFDAKAVRTEDFLWAMEEGGGIDLTQFRLWYSQERTPMLHVTSHYDAAQHELHLQLRQEIPNNTAHQKQKPYMYPLGIALFDPKGEAIEIDAKDQPMCDRGILLIQEQVQNIVLRHVVCEPKLSLNRNFTAPIKLHYPQSDYAFLMRYDTDGFNRYEASQEFAKQTLFDAIKTDTINLAYIEAFGVVLHDDTLDKMLKSQILELPSVSVLMQEQDIIDIEGIYRALKALKKRLFEHHGESMAAMYDTLHEPDSAAIDSDAMSKRALKNLILSYLVSSQNSDMVARCELQYTKSVTMTDRIMALDLLENFAPDRAQFHLKDFYEKYRNDTLTMNKYFSILSAADRSDVLDRVQALQHDPCFDIKIPNLVRSLYGVFARNMRHFHDANGYGYEFIADKIIHLNGINPMIAAGLAGAFKSYPKLDTNRKKMMYESMQRILLEKNLSKNVYEIIEKICND
jgi:aminopeptidase N